MSQGSAHRTTPCAALKADGRPQPWVWAQNCCLGRGVQRRQSGVTSPARAELPAQSGSSKCSCVPLTHQPLQGGGGRFSLLALQRCHFSQAQCQLESCLLFGCRPTEHCLRPLWPRCSPGAASVHLSPNPDHPPGTGAAQSPLAASPATSATLVGRRPPGFLSDHPCRLGRPMPRGAIHSQWEGRLRKATAVSPFPPFLGCARAQGLSAGTAAPASCVLWLLVNQGVLSAQYVAPGLRLP